MLSVGQQPTTTHVFLNWESKNKSLFFFLGGAEQLKNEPTQMIVLEWLFLTIVPCDAAEPWQLGFQDAATPMMQGIMDLHHDIFFFLILILVFVSRILVRALWHFHYKKNPIPQRIVHGTTIEILRTIFPSIILMFIAIPSFALLYSMDEVVVDPAITIKAIGHQWYRTYEYSDYNSSDEQSLTFDSYTIPEDDLELGQSRLLEVDNRVVLPAKTHLRIIVTPADVPHSWAVPSSGVKCDAVPGRLNQISISVQREGVYYGQCSEICGTNHAFTPIVVEAVPRKDYGSRVVPDRSPMAASPMEPRLSPWDLISGANREPSPFCGSQMEVAGPSNPLGGSAPPLPIESGTVPPANAVTFSEAGPSQVAPPDPSFLIPPEEVSQDALWGALESTARSLMQSRAYRATDRALERFYYEQNELATLLAGMLPQRGIVANAEDVRRAVSALTDDIYENHEGRPKRMRALKNSLINRPEGKAWRNFIQHLRELGVSVNADDGPR